LRLLNDIGGDESGDEDGNIACRKRKQEGSSSPVVAGICDCCLTDCSSEI
jgi:hypothetical protein